MKTLSKQAETQLLSAVKNVVGHVDNGDDPTDAVVKVAQELELPRGHLQLLCSAYNTGRVNAQRKMAAASIMERFEDIPLADHEKAAQQIWPDKIETPSERLSKTAVSDDYRKAPHWLAPCLTSPPARKAASAEPLVLTPAQRKDAAWKTILDGQRRIQDVRPKSSAARDNMVASMQTLTGYFKRANCLPFSEVHYAVASDPAAEALMQVVGASLGREKQAAVVPRVMHSVVWTEAPYTLIKEALAACELAVNARRELVELEASIKTAREEVYGPSGAHKSGSEKVGAGGSIFGTALGTTFGSTLPKPKSTGERVESAVTALDDPDHENAMRNIQITAMLRDMMSNDEVIKGYEPEEVLHAYNQISQTAPTVAMHSIALGPELRSVLQRNRAPHETSQLVGLEKDLRGLRPPLGAAPEKKDTK
jgi:hypothetical protein